MDPNLYPGPHGDGVGGASSSNLRGTPPLYQPHAVAIPTPDSVGKRVVADRAPNPSYDAEGATSFDPENLRMKRKRASKACDACRVRKVKCDTSRVPCPQCREHEIPCLFTAPAKKRGPPNAYVEALRSRMQQTSSHQYLSPYSPAEGLQTASDGRSSTPVGSQAADQDYNTPKLPSGDGHHAHSLGFNGLSVAHNHGMLSLAPQDILDVMFEDFFNLVFPICPIILESQFRDRLANPSMYTDSFLALSGAILGATLACLRLNHVKYGGLVYEDAYKFATGYLGTNYRDRITVETAATLEYLSLGDAFSNPLPILLNTRNHMLRSEFNMAVQCLARTRIKSCGFAEAQLVKRMFAHIYRVQISLDLQGLALHTAPDSLDKLAESLMENMTPLDLSESDIQKFDSSNGDNIPAAEAGTQFSALLVPSAKSYVAGLNLVTGFYKIYFDGIRECNVERLSDGARLSRMFEILHKLGRHLDNVPVQLRWEENNKVHGLGFEVQKALIYVTRMHLSSTVLEQCYSLKSVSSQRNILQELDRERRLVITETLRIIKTISRRALEANGLSFIVNIRQVASTLVDVIEMQQDEQATKARQELSEFSEILSILDPRPSTDPKVHTEAREECLIRAEDGWRRFRNEQVSNSNQSFAKRT